MIRTYRDSDLARLREITEVCFEAVSIERNIHAAFGEIGGRDWRFRKAREIDEDICVNPEGVLVYEDDGEIAGYITARTDAETRVGWIPNLAVLPDRQRKGIGRALMDAALAYLAGKGMELARIETLEQNPVGTVFYPGTGFQEVARQIHYAMRL